MNIAATIRNTISRTLTASLLSTAMFSAGANAAVFVEDFDDASLDPQLSQSTDSGFSMSLLSNQARLDKASLTGNGELRVQTTFDVIGDFSATLEVERIDLVSDASVGMMATHSTLGSNDLGLVSSNFGFSRMQMVPTNSSVLDSNLATTAILKMSRVGSTITHAIDYGSGFVNLDSQSQPNHADPLQLSFFLRQQAGDTSSQQAWVDNFEITADAFSAGPPLPAPAPAGATLAALVGLVLLRRREQSQ